MPGGIGVDTPSSRTVEQRRARGQGVLFGRIQIRYPEVQMELLRSGRIRPLRCPEVGYALKGEDEAGRCMQGCPAVAESPPAIRTIDGASEQRSVKLGEERGLGTIEDDALEFGDHDRTA